MRLTYNEQNAPFYSVNVVQREQTQNISVSQTQRLLSRNISAALIKFIATQLRANKVILVEYCDILQKWPILSLFSSEK